VCCGLLPLRRLFVLYKHYDPLFLRIQDCFEKAAACLRRPNKCQKRPAAGAKETWYVRTCES
jgi:hypothetical protein